MTGSLGMKGDIGMRQLSWVIYPKYDPTSIDLPEEAKVKTRVLMVASYER